MSYNILFVDDNRLILAMLADIFRDEPYCIHTAGSVDESLEILLHKEIAVVVSDNVMPGMSGLEFLAELKSYSPDTVKIMMTAYADLSTTMIAINSSEVYRFMVKPFKAEEMVSVVRDAVKRYTLQMALRREDESVLLSLAQAIELKDPSTRGHCDRVAEHATAIATAMGLPRLTVRDIRYGSWLHDCGKIGIPEAILNGNHRLSDEEFEHIKQHSEWGADVAEKARISQTACNIIRYHHERVDGKGYPDGLAGDSIPLEARIVAVADVYDALVTDRPYRQGYPHAVVVDMLRDMRGSALDTAIVDVFLGESMGSGLDDLNVKDKSGGSP